MSPVSVNKVAHTRDIWISHHVQLSISRPHHVLYAHGVCSRDGSVPTKFNSHVSLEAWLVVCRSKALLIQMQHLDLKLATRHVSPCVTEPAHDA